MPYFYDQNLEDDELQNQPGEVQISGASPTTDSDGTQGDGSAPTKKEGINTGSGFQNLDSYLNTNQSKEFGQQVLGKVENEVAGARDNQNQASNQFKTQVSDLNKTPTSNDVNSAIANPTGADKNAFQDWMSQTYQGPHSLGESQDTWNQYWSGTNKANTQAKLLGNEAGRFSLLDTYFGKPSYSFGEKSLDNLLVQQSGLGKETRNLQNEAAQLKSQGASGARDLQNMAGEKAAQVDQSRESVLGAIGLDAQGRVVTGEKAGAIGKEYQSVMDQLAEENRIRKEQQDTVKRLTGKNVLTQEDFIKFGLQEPVYHNTNGTPIYNNSVGGSFTHDAFGRPIGEYDTSGYKPGRQLFNMNLGDYLSYGSELNRDQTMSPEQRARIRALSELSGLQDTFAQNENQAKTDAYGFDTNRFYGDQRAQAEAFTNEWANSIQKDRNYTWHPDSESYDSYKANKEAIRKEREAIVVKYNLQKKVGITNPDQQDDWDRFAKYFGAEPGTDQYNQWMEYFKTNGAKYSEDNPY